MTPEEIERACREARRMSDEQLAKLVGEGSEPWPPEAWEILKAEQSRRERVLMDRAGLVDQVEAEINALVSGVKGSAAGITTLLLTLTLFIALGFFTISWSGLVILVLVLLIHESGHLVGMKLFRYRDVQMLFIPLLGAAVAGTETNPSGARRAIVSLLGPGPGIVIGIVLGTLT
jgi:hypothetical protein